jgi:general secretion pathway protein C
MTALTPILMLLCHRRAAQLVIALLVVYIAYVSAKITWLVVPQNQLTHNTSVNNHSKNLNSNKESKTINVANIQKLNLFGQYNESVEEQAQVEMAEVPETTLNLTLSGLVASDDKSIAAAIVENQGQQNTYGIGDTITGTRATLEQVLMDRVIIKQSGRLETLMLDGFDYNQPIPKKPRPEVASKPPRLGVVDQRNNKELTATAKNLRNEFSNNPEQIGDYLRISPKLESGKVIGYILRPGKKADFFKQAGLKIGDVAVEMNGLDLIDSSQALQAMSEMKKARDISLLVNRQGDLTEILISLD